MATLTVGELRKVIEGMPDGAPVVIDDCPSNARCGGIESDGACDTEYQLDPRDGDYIWRGSDKWVEGAPSLRALYIG